METKDKRLYVRPAMTVVELQHTKMLLTGSFKGNRDNPYGTPTDPWSE